MLRPLPLGSEHGVVNNSGGKWYVARVWNGQRALARKSSPRARLALQTPRRDLLRLFEPNPIRSGARLRLIYSGIGQVIPKSLRRSFRARCDRDPLVRSMSVRALEPLAQSGGQAGFNSRCAAGWMIQFAPCALTPPGRFHGSLNTNSAPLKTC